MSSSCWRCLFSCWFETDVKEPTLLIVKNRGHSPRELRTTPDSVNMWSQWMRSVIEWYRQPVACCIWLPSRFIYGKEDIFSVLSSITWPDSTLQLSASTITSNHFNYIQPLIIDCNFTPHPCRGYFRYTKLSNIFFYLVKWLNSDKENYKT